MFRSKKSTDVLHKQMNVRIFQHLFMPSNPYTVHNTLLCVLLFHAQCYSQPTDGGALFELASSQVSAGERLM